MAVKLVTDSTSYIDENTQKNLDIKVVHLSVHFPDESFDETMVPYDYFYEKIEKDDIIPTSSQPTLQEIYDVFKEIIVRGEEVLGIFLSAKMSGTYASALMAKKMIMEEYPKACIEVIDSKTNCMAMGIQVIEAAMAAKSGKKMKEVIETAQRIMERVRFYFVPASLQYLIKGGRIGGAAALIGSLLHIRPILFVNDGMTDVFERVRGTHRAINRMLSLLNEDAKKYGLKHLLVHHINDDQQGRKLADKLRQQYNRDIPVLPIGPVIGLHVGPSAVAIVYSTED
ncbi:MAG: DegV family protein [Syntrophomonadaceae bacterium]|nr:DegV family protein [Syntrophomonadaceae bacterium]